MTMLGVCPQRATLERLSLGKLAESELSEVASHVEQCTTCQGILAALENDARQVHLRRELQGAGVTEDVSSAHPATDDGSSEEPKTRINRPPARLGQYDVLEKLGEGGMGAVYTARHRKLDRLVALKLLPGDRLQDSQALERFHREMLVLGRLEHPHIVRAHDAGEDQGVHFLVMEHVAGCDLAEYVKRRGPLPVAEACEYVCQAAAGLAYAHQAGILHRDVKPSNLLRDGSSGRIKVLDLGLAKVVSKRSQQANTMTAAGEVFGTVDFMAPEQGLDVGSVDARADVYSLGCTLYYLLTGKRLFEGDIAERMISHRIRPAPKLSAACGEVSRALERVFQKMIAKKPSDRYATMDEVVAALRPFASAGPAGAGSEDRTQTAPKLSTAAGLGKRRGLLTKRRFAASVGVAAAIALIVWKTRTKPEVPASPAPPSQPVVDSAGELVMADFSTKPFDPEYVKRYQQAWTEQLKKHGLPLDGETVELTNALGMRLLVVPPGKFQMGSTREETANYLRNTPAAKTSITKLPISQLPAALAREGLNIVHDRMAYAAEPPHPVTITYPLLVGATEVTIGQFRQFVDDLNKDLPADKQEKVTTAEQTGLGQVWMPEQNKWSDAPGVSWKNPDGASASGPLSDDLPVVQLTRLDMAKFCNWLSRRDSLPEAYQIVGNEATLKGIVVDGPTISLPATLAGYRLPTEAEWEYFCRAGSSTAYFWGEKFNPDAGRYGHFEPDELKRRLIGGTPVGMKGPNWFGLFDVAGNVFEMCEDDFNNAAYKDSAPENPLMLSPMDKPSKVIRGGPLPDSNQTSRSAGRWAYDPTKPYGDLGFRIVRTLVMGSVSTTK